MVKMLLCCAAGMSTSILVRMLREEAESRGLDCKIGATSTTKVAEYIPKADVLLIAPHVAFEEARLRRIAEECGTRVVLIDWDAYSSQQAGAILDSALDGVGGTTHGKTEEGVREMDAVTTFIEKRIAPAAGRLGANVFVNIIKDGLTATIALLIIGSVSTLLANLPVEALASLIAPLSPMLNAISACTTGLLALLVVGAIGFYGAGHLDIDRMPAVVTSIAAFAITQYGEESGVNIEGLGTTGLFTAMVVGLTVVYTLHFFESRNIGIKLPDSVPPAVAGSFSSLIPASLLMVAWGLVSIVLGLDVNAVMTTVLTPVTSVINTPWGYGLYHLLCGLVFWCGINSAVIMNVAMPFTIANGAANEVAVAAGQAPLFPATYGLDTMIWAGGTGATIGLAILMAFRAKSQQMRSIGKMSLGPAIFNINEPVIFGTPICYNGLFLIPFVLLPGVLAFASYALMDAGVIAMGITSMVPWTLPPVVCAFLMSGGAVSTTIWGVLIVVISLVVYYPFFRIADNQAYRQEQAGEAGE